MIVIDSKLYTCSHGVVVLGCNICQCSYLTGIIQFLAWESKIQLQRIADNMVINGVLYSCKCPVVWKGNLTIQADVEARFGILIHPEVNFIA